MNQQVNVASNLDELKKLLQLAAHQAEQLKHTLELINDFKIEAHLKP